MSVNAEKKKKKKKVRDVEMKNMEMHVRSYLKPFIHIN